MHFRNSSLNIISQNWTIHKPSDSDLCLGQSDSDQSLDRSNEM